MFYEEKVLNGVLHSRTSPEETWVELTSKQLTERLLSTRKFDLTQRNNQLADSSGSISPGESVQAGLTYFSAYWLHPKKDGVFPEVPDGITEAIAFDEDASGDSYIYVRLFREGKWHEPVQFSNSAQNGY